MTKSYGINQRVAADNDIDAAVESLRTLGYAVVDGGYSASELAAFSQGSILRVAPRTGPRAAPKCWRGSTNITPYARRSPMTGAC
jgi:hypothetical protein